MKRVLPAVVCVALLGVGCQTDDPTQNPSSIPTTPVNPTVENFAGTVVVKGSDTKPFTVVFGGGTLTVTLVSVTPSTQMSLSVGAFDATNTCAPVTNGTTIAGPSPTPPLAGTVPAGNYCLIVADAGSQTAPVTYTATVTHY